MFSRVPCSDTPMWAFSRAEASATTWLQLRVQLPHPVGRLAPRERAAAVGGQHAEAVRRGGRRQSARPARQPTSVSGIAHRPASRRRRSPRRARARMPRSRARRAPAPRAPATGSAERWEGATNVTAPPNTAARSARSSAPRTWTLRSGMPAAAARSAIAGSSPSPASITTTGRSRPERAIAAKPERERVGSARRGRRAARSPPADPGPVGDRPRRPARRTRDGAAPAMTRIRSPSFAISPSRRAIACVGTTTASACLTARLSIARCHPTADFGQLAGCVPRAEIPDRHHSLVVVVHAIVPHERREQRRRVDHAPADARSHPELQRGGELPAGQRGPAHAGEPGDLDRPVRLVRRARWPRPRSRQVSRRSRARVQLARCASRGRDRWERRAGRASREASPSCRLSPRVSGVGVGGWSACWTSSWMYAKSGSYSSIPPSGVSSIVVTGCSFALSASSARNGSSDCGRSVWMRSCPAVATSWNRVRTTSRRELREDRLLQLTLALHPVEVDRSCSATGRTTARCRRPCAAGRPRSSRRPLLGGLTVVGRPAALGQSLLDGDVDAAERVDERREAVHVDEDVVRDLDAENALRGVLGRLDPRLRAVRHGIGVESVAVLADLDLGAQLVDAAPPAAASSRRDPSWPFGYLSCMGPAEKGTFGMSRGMPVIVVAPVVGVHRDHRDAVEAHGVAALAAVGAEQQDVVVAVGGRHGRPARPEDRAQSVAGGAGDLRRVRRRRRSTRPGGRRRGRAMPKRATAPVLTSRTRRSVSIVSTIHSTA